MDPHLSFNKNSVEKEFYKFFKEQENCPEESSSLNFLEQADIWKVIEVYFKEHSLVQQQLDSFNKFIEVYIPRILKHVKCDPLRNDIKKCYHEVRYGNFYLKRPVFTELNRQEHPVFPDECRKRRISYTSPAYCDIYITTKYDDGRVEEKKTEKVKIAEIPIMIKSKYCALYEKDRDDLIKYNECPYDPGGYMILNGKEKGLIAQERLSYNQVFVFTKKQNLEVQIRCFNEEEDQQSTVEMRHVTNKKYGGCLRVIVPHVHEPKGIYLFALFYALGITDNQTIKNLIVYPNKKDISMLELLQGSVLESEHLVGETPRQTRLNALTYISSYVKPRIPTTNAPIQKPKTKLEMLLEILNNELFPHLHDQDEGTVKDRNKQKAWYLAYCIQRLLRVELKIDDTSDRDHMSYKRLNLSGPLLAMLFKKKMQKQHNDMMAHLRKLIQRNKDLNLHIAMKPRDVTRGLAYSLKTGNWNTSRNQISTSNKNEGVSQVLNRLNYIAPLSHLRRTTASDTTLSVVRQQHNTQLGVCCVTGDTKILLASGFTVPIKDIYNHTVIQKSSIRICVMTVNPVTLEDEPSEITNLFCIDTPELLKISTHDGKSIRCTRDHPFLVKRDSFYVWIQAGDLKLDDILITISGVLNSTYDLEYKRTIQSEKTESKIMSIIQCNPEKVYDFTTISENHSFIADGFVTHNCPNETPEGQSCLTLETLIETPLGDIPIGNLKNGDIVISVDPKTYLKTETTIHSYFQKEAQVFKIILQGGWEINATTDHPFLTPKGWKTLDEFIDNQTLLYNQDGKFVFLSIVCIKSLGIKTVADFTTISDNHSFIANGFVTHNCGLVKNLSLLCHISIGSDSRTVYKFLEKTKEFKNYFIPLTELDPNKSVYGWKVFVNGRWIGVSHDKTGDKTIDCFTKDYIPKPIPEWVTLFREARSQGVIRKEISISSHTSMRKEIHIFTDEGRFCRPLLIVDQKTNLPRINKSHISKLQTDLGDESVLDANVIEDTWSWQDLQENRLVEYLDIAEVESARIAMKFQNVYKEYTQNQTDLSNPNNLIATKKIVPRSVQSPTQLSTQLSKSRKEIMKKTIFTHSEIHPAMLLGVCASIIPFPNHNQSPRNTYESAMMKQAIGLFSMTYNDRFDTTNYVLHYPQSPLVRTKTMEVLKLHELPNTQVAIVAIAEYTGYNQEDGVIMNQGCIDRGFARISLYKTYPCEAKKQKILADETFEKPNPEECMGVKKACYDKLGPDGIVEVGTRVGKDDVLVGKTGPSDTFSSFSRTRSYNKTGTVRVQTNISPKYTKQDHSLISKSEGIVDKVIASTNSDGNKFVSIRVRDERIPEIGDKMAAMSGQKGTIGMILQECDMPRSDSGMIPDIIMNPHCLPSRMTVGQLKETLMGKLCALNGEIANATPFDEDARPVDDISAELAKLGFDSRGWETMYNGLTGEKFRAKIFIGPTTYQRLKHMVSDKVHSRARGPVTILTRQPVEGRTRDGGLRFGEMERDTLLAHGAAHMLKKRLNDHSDKYTVPICEMCGLFAQADTIRKVHYCGACDSYDHVKFVDMPYAAKLLFQELMSMMIVPRFQLK